MKNKKRIVLFGLMALLLSIGFGAKNIQASLSYLTITKVDADNPTLTLEGAVFEVRSQDGSHVETITTNAEGKATIALNPTIYYITEVKAPKGYTILEENKEIRVDATVSDGMNLTINNQRISSLKEDTNTSDQNSNNQLPTEDSQLNQDHIIPETGYHSALMMFGLGGSFLAVGIYLARKVRKAE